MAAVGPAAATSGPYGRFFLGAVALAVALVLLASLRLRFGVRATTSETAVVDDRSDLLATIGLASVVEVVVLVFLLVGIPSG